MSLSRYVFLFAFLLIASGNLFAQSDTLPIYKKFPTIPPFKLAAVPDSSTFQKANLNNKKATIFIMFSPDCDHCQHATKDLIENIDGFKKVQIVMASSMPYGQIATFYKDYNIAKYPNIKMGYDAGYNLGTFFSVRNFPSIYLYDKKGQFVKYFEGSIPFATIAESL